MSLLAVGSVAYDSVKTPFGEVEDALGGSGTYFSVAASFFTKVYLVACVGNDFQSVQAKITTRRFNINLSCTTCTGT